MSEDETEIGSLSQSLGERLRHSDGEALKEVYDRYATAVTSRLKVRFGNVLDDSDLDDVVSQALLRLWIYRNRYDPQRASLYTWFYLIARSLALEAIRRRASESQVYLSDLSSAQRDQLTAESADRTSMITTSSPSPELIAVDGLLAKLPEQDRRILLAFAEHQGQGSWASDLAVQWHVPASTVRSRKRRAMQRLREELESQGFTLTRGENKMCALANHPDQDAKVARTMTPEQRALSVQFGNCPFIMLHATEVEHLMEGFRLYFAELPSFGAAQGFAHFVDTWNRAYERDDLNDLAQRQFLVDTFRWLRQRKKTEDSYRARLEKFVASALEVEQLRQSSFGREAATERLNRIETALAGLGRGLEELQPADVARKGAGRLYARWDDNDAQFSWQTTFESSVSLRAAATQAFSLYGEFPMQAAASLAAVFVQNVRMNHFVLPPNFEFPEELHEGAAPTYWEWAPAAADLSNEVLPAWIFNRERGEGFPNPSELEMRSRNPELADLLDKLLIEAALADVADQQQAAMLAEHEQATAPSAIEQLIEAVAFACDRSTGEVAEFFDRSLRGLQANVGSPEQCHANTEALRFLWSQLSEQAS